MFEILGAVGDELLVHQSLVQDYFGHSVKQGHVGTRVGAEPQVGVIAHVDSAGVDNDELSAPFHHGPAHAGGRHRVVGSRVAADDHQATGILVVGVGVAGGAAAQGGQHGLHRWRVAQAGAVVDVVGLHDEAGKLLLDVPVLVGGLGRAEGAEVVVPVVDQPVGDQVQGLVPGGLAELTVLTN